MLIRSSEWGLPPVLLTGGSWALRVLSRPGLRPARVYDPGVDLIVCGDALWISCGTWIAVWNGFIGASAAAAAGALVALVVVRLTNGQQRHGVERTVEVAAIADFVAAVGELDWALRYRMQEPTEFDSGPYILRMRAAIARLMMARPESREIADILMLWPEKLHNLVVIVPGVPHEEDVKFGRNPRSGF